MDRTAHTPIRRTLLSPWQAWTSPCPTRFRCAAASLAPQARRRWRADPRITSTSYGTATITYRVDLDQPVLMRENEISFPGWSADHGVRRVESERVLRTWALPAGRYRFTASYRQPERSAQLLLAALALVAWAATGVAMRYRLRGPRAAARPASSS